VKPLILFTVVVGALVGGSTEAASPFFYDRHLGVVARDSLWRAVSDGPRIARSDVLKVYVRCYRDTSSFEQVFERKFGESATRVIAFYTGGADLYLRNGTCAQVHVFLGGAHTVYTAGAYSILLHEALHRQGVRDERITTCLASDAVRWGALWFGFDEQQSLRARNLAFTYTRLFAPRAYFMGKPTCLALTRRTEWIDHRQRSG
jgi:hypothetical protein